MPTTLTSTWRVCGSTPASRYSSTDIGTESSTHFLRAVRRRDDESFANFDLTLEEASLHIGTGSEDFAAGLLLSEGRLDEFIGVYTDIEAFDPACDAFTSLIQAWMKEVPGAFIVTHDQSRPMKRNEHFLRTLMKPLPSRQMGFSNRKGELSLRISHLEFADSAAHPQIQVADLIAGAAIDCLLSWSGKRASSDYHESMKETRLAELFMGGILPSPTIDKAADPIPGEESIVDGAAQFLYEVPVLQTLNAPDLGARRYIRSVVVEHAACGAEAFTESERHIPCYVRRSDWH